MMQNTFDRVHDAHTRLFSQDEGYKRLDPTMDLSDRDFIDSLDLLDFLYEVDKVFGVRIPLEEWTDKVNEGADSDHYFLLTNFCDRVDELVVAKQEV